MTHRAPALIVLSAMVAFALTVVSCASGETAVEPERVVVQHILVSFAGQLPGRPIERNEDEARQLAYEILEKARGGDDFDALVKEFTDDQHPGIYGMVDGAAALKQNGDYARADMVPGFGDVSFSLPPGGIDICEFDGEKSPFGYHVIKRLE